MRRWSVPVLLAAVALTSTVYAVRTPDATGPSPGAGVLAPVLSPRRAPSLLARLVADGRLATRLDAVFAQPALGLARERSCLAVDVDHRPVYRRNVDDLLTPASNLKLVTALAALTKLGPTARFETEARAAHAPVAGVLDGPLWLVGGGDPLLATADYLASFQNQPQVGTPLETLADRIRDAGVREIRGGIIGDESRYDAQRYLPSWKAGYITDAEIGPESALDVNDGFVQWRPKHVAAPDPAAHAAGLLASLLVARGVRVAGEAASGRAPATAMTVATLESLPLADVVGEMLRESDNLTAELLVKEMGRALVGRGTTADGVAALRGIVDGAGLSLSELVNVDGSGLARADKTTCSLLLEVLSKRSTASAIAAGLPVAGRSGTLARRFTGSPAVGRLRAKTGSLDYVTALTGYMGALRGPDVAFSLLANDLPDKTASGRDLQDRVAAALASYPDAPDPALLAPRSR